MTILATRTILPRDPSPQTNKGAIAGGLVAAIAVVIIAAVGLFFLRWRCTKVSPTVFIADPVPNEASVPMTINTQPEPSIEKIKGSSDDEAPGLSTMPDLPTSPMKVYDPNNVATFPEPQDDLYIRSISSRAIFGQYRGTETTPVLVNTQGHSVLPTLLEPRYDPYARGVSQVGFGQYQGTTGNTPRQINTQVPQSPGHGGLPTSTESQEELYSPNISPRVIFGQHQGTANTLPNIRASQPLGYSGLPTV